MGQIISFIKKRLLGQFFYCIKKCFCRQREEKEDCDEHYSLDISTPELLDPLNYNKTDPCFKLHQNVSTTYFDPVEENRQDSAHVLNVDNLEERDVRDPEGWIRHYCSSQEMLLSSEAFGSDPSSDNETDSSFRLHQNVSTTCFDPVKDNRQDSAYVLDVDNLEERDDPERWIRHYCSSHKMLLSGEAFGSDPSSDNKTDSGFRLHQNVSTTCFDPVEDNRQDSAYVLDVDNLEERDNPERWIRHYCSSHKMLFVDDVDFPLSPGLARAFDSDPSSDSLADSSFRLHQNVSTTCFDVVEKNRQDHSADVLNVDDLEEREVLRGPKRWIRHYCSSHKILLVGEGDFSFSASLARAFGSAINMVATSLDSTDFLLRNYKSAMSNIQELRTRGCLVLHGVDATKMANHYYLGDIKFDRVVYNFPHAGFRFGESRRSQISRHQLLISLFFKNAEEMINENGEIHVRHKCNGFFLDWNLQGLASAVGLRLIQEVPFNFTDYPGYHTKYGFGGDKNFNCNPCKTYIFGLFPSISVSPRKYYTYN